MTVRVDESGFDNPGKMFSTDLHERLLNLLHAIPHGVLGMSHAVEGLVETSTNLAVIKTGPDAVSVLTSQRSSVNSALDNVVSIMAAAGNSPVRASTTPTAIPPGSPTRIPRH